MMFGARALDGLVTRTACSFQSIGAGILAGAPSTSCRILTAPTASSAELYGRALMAHTACVTSGRTWSQVAGPFARIIKGRSLRSGPAVTSRPVTSRRVGRGQLGQSPTIACVTGNSSRNRPSRAFLLRSPRETPPLLTDVLLLRWIPSPASASGGRLHVPDRQHGHPAAARSRRQHTSA
jgi:hypothetical protein